MIMFPLIIIALSSVGFFIALYIHEHKTAGGERKLVCPLNFQCDPVIHSPYSVFWGFQVQILGLIYYALITISYSALEIFPFLFSPVAVASVLGITVLAFLFSLYLTFVQAFALKQWCTWCLVSAIICTLIFSLSLAMWW